MHRRLFLKGLGLIGVVSSVNLEFVEETLFNPETDAPITEHDISGLKNRLYVVSLCNKHDAWLNTLAL